MARAAWGVIGAGYGDEGKGLMVDALAHAFGPGTLVVRTNGGAQAGHTVETPDGHRHVFHHLGSGALAGGATHLSRWFVHHPMVLGRELAAVAALGGCTTVTADPRGYVTTPWDMLVNQIAEQARGERRHGSCGYGFGETVGRCEETALALTVADLAAPDLRDKLEAIRNVWLPARLQSLGLSRVSADTAALLRSPALLERYLADCAAFLRHVHIAPDAAIGCASSVIFEGAQGLLLDQQLGAFPYVTRSNTGLANMLAVAGEAGIDRIEAVYVTRCYLTRHGRGPMPNENDIAGTFAVDDATNLPNAWQESLRFGELDLDLLGRTVRRDARLARSTGCEVVTHLAVTCLDQALGPIPFRRGGERRREGEAMFVRDAAAAVHAAAVATSRGPTRSTVDLDGLIGERRAAA